LVCLVIKESTWPQWPCIWHSCFRCILNFSSPCALLLGAKLSKDVKGQSWCGVRVLRRVVGGTLPHTGTTRARTDAPLGTQAVLSYGAAPSWRVEASCRAALVDGAPRAPLYTCMHPTAATRSVAPPRESPLRPGTREPAAPGHGDLTHLSMQDACMPTYVRAFALAPPVHAFSRASLGSRSYRRVSIPLTCARLRRTSTTFRDHDIGRDARRYTLLRH
jgi:hypothetical protein